MKTGTIKNAYLFVGSAGTGKTTCARIFANEINNGEGNPIEMDAASNSSVEDVRNIIQQAKTKAIDSEYKVFIIDECHAISNTGWQAFLKLIEEPPAKSIFIFCTTDPQKIPKTILSRVQRYDFQRISEDGISNRLMRILSKEGLINSAIDSHEAVEYIAKLAEGGMRDAISLMDKCLAYNQELTLQNVVATLGSVDYETMFHLNNSMFDGNVKEVVQTIETIHNSGKDLKQFLKAYCNFLLDIMKFSFGCDFKLMRLPKLEIYVKELESYGDFEFDYCMYLLEQGSQLCTDIKYSSYVKDDIEAKLMLICIERKE